MLHCTELGIQSVESFKAPTTFVAMRLILKNRGDRYRSRVQSRVVTDPTKSANTRPTGARTFTQALSKNRDDSFRRLMPSHFFEAYKRSNDCEDLDSITRNSH